MNQLGIRVERVSKSWGTQSVLRDISLTIPKGQFTALLGPSGCGKTTLLRVIAGLESQDTGRVYVNDRDISTVDTDKRGMSFVFQNYALFPHLTVKDNILFGLQTRRVPHREQMQRLLQITSLLKIDGLLQRKPAALSGGQQQRTALARAMISGRPICLMDEPLSNLDATLRQSMRTELRELQRELDITMVYVTHDQTEAMTMADQVALMHEGRVAQCASPVELFDCPTSVQVARFIGAPAMNVLSMGGHSQFSALSGKIGYLGIRPESIQIVSHSAFPAKVLSAEFHGSSSIVHVEMAGMTMSVKTDARLHMPSGATIFLHIDASDIHLFDAMGQACPDRDIASVCLDVFRARDLSSAPARPSTPTTTGAQVC